MGCEQHMQSTHYILHKYQAVMTANATTLEQLCNMKLAVQPLQHMP